MSAWSWIAVVLQLASRLAYVVGVGTMLLREKQTRWFTSRYGTEAGYRRFRRTASALMNLDAVTFALACWFTRGTLGFPGPATLRIAAGLLAIGVGATTKIWARSTLGSSGYHWRDFFDPAAAKREPGGPYRYLKNPMYTVGYLHAYGIALVFDTAPGIVLAACMQAAILAFHFVVERPHFAEHTHLKGSE